MTPLQTRQRYRPEVGAEVGKLAQAQNNCVVQARMLPRKVLSGTVAQGKKRYQRLKARYGPRYTRAMLRACERIT